MIRQKLRKRIKLLQQKAADAKKEEDKQKLAESLIRLSECELILKNL